MKPFYLILLSLTVSFSAFSQKNIPIKNSSFKSDLQDWDTVVWGEEYDEPKALFDITKKGRNDSKALKVSVRKNSSKKNGDQIFIKQNGFKLKKGKEYRISFWVKSRAYNDQIMFRIFSAPDTGSSKPWGAVVDKTFEFDGKGEWIKLTHTFIAEPIYENKNIDYKKLAILVGFDKRMGTYLVDDFILERL